MNNLNPKHLFVLICLLIAPLAKAQNAFYDYYKNINRAELAICDSNFIKANEYYTFAFKANSDKAFYRDLQNALYVALDTRAYDLAREYFQKLKHFKLFAKTLDQLSNHYPADVIAQLEVYKREYKNTAKTKWATDSIVSKLWEMRNLDQHVRMHFSKKNNGAYMVDSVYEVDIRNAQDLLAIFNQYGLPDEDVAYETGYEIIIVHNCYPRYKNMRGHIFDTLLYKSIFTFDYDARNLPNIIQSGPPADVFSYGATTLSFPLTPMGCFFNGKVYPKKYAARTAFLINKERSKIGLSSLAELSKKIETENKGVAQYCIYSKYKFRDAMTVVDVKTEEELLLCQEKKIQLYMQMDRNIPQIAVGKIVADFDTTLGAIHGQYIIGKTHWNEKQKRRAYIGEIGYNAGQVMYEDWNNLLLRIGQLYMVEAVPNPRENLYTDKGRYNKSRFVSGYKILIERGFDLYGYSVLDFVETIYDLNTDSTMISFTADVDAELYSRMLSDLGVPTNRQLSTDTLKVTFDNKEKRMLLRTSVTTWVKGNKQLELFVSDRINKRGRKYTKASINMIDINRMAKYTEQLLEEEQRLATDHVQ
ncbi:MAG: hypothetical protein R2800_11415 [Flavipsychrobacter sp.]